MTITVEIAPEAQAELARQAAEQGSVLETYAARLLEEAAMAQHPSLLGSEERIETALREMAKFSSKIPPLPDSALTRESIYQDQD